MDNLLKEVQRILEQKDLTNEVSDVINKLASEYVKLNNKGKLLLDDEIIPNIDALKYQAGITGSKTVEGNNLEQIRDRLQEHLRNKHSEKFLNITNDKAARNAVENEIVSFCNENVIQIRGMDRKETIDFLKSDILDYGILSDLIFEADEDVKDKSKKIEEIRTNDFDDVRVVVDGTEYETDLKFESPEQLLAIAQKICRNYRADMIKPDRPFVRVRMGNNIRVSMMANPVARRPDDLNGTVLQMAIRKQSSEPFSKDFLINKGTLDEYSYRLIDLIIRRGISAVFFGGTNSGKTALMTSFAHNIDKEKRIISAAEIDEMNLRKVDAVTKRALNSVLMWEIKPERGMDFRKLVNSSLTFTPEALILQETKGPEVVDIIEASITDHQVLTSLHAKNMEVFGIRILTMYKQSGSDLSENLILNLVVQAFPFIIRTKLYADGVRRVAEIGELVKYDRNKGEFEIRKLVEFDVEDTKEVKAYNEYLNKEMTKKVVYGKHKKFDFISEDLIKELLDNGTPKSEIDELKKLYEGR